MIIKESISINQNNNVSIVVFTSNKRCRNIPNKNKKNKTFIYFVFGKNTFCITNAPINVKITST